VWSSAPCAQGWDISAATNCLPSRMRGNFAACRCNAPAAFSFLGSAMTVQHELTWLRILVQIWREQVAIDSGRVKA